MCLGWRAGKASLLSACCPPYSRSSSPAPRYSLPHEALLSLVSGVDVPASVEEAEAAEETEDKVLETTEAETEVEAVETAAAVESEAPEAEAEASTDEPSADEDETQEKAD